MHIQKEIENLKRRMDTLESLFNTKPKEIVEEGDSIPSLDRWVDKEKAMSYLGCRNTKLGELTKSNKIMTRGMGKSRYYYVKSMQMYLDSKK